MMADIVDQVDKHESRLHDHEQRISGVEEDLYGDERSRRAGLVMQTQDTQVQMRRLILVVWGLVIAITILAATVAMTVLI